MTNTTTSIESELGKLQGLPTPVASWRVEVGLDATEEPAVWVWVTPEHDDVDAKTLADMRDVVRASVREMVGDDADWGYVARDNQGENAATIKMRMPRRLAAL